MDNIKHRRLQELDRSDFEIVKDEPDIRGWDVKNNIGKKVGAVEELILDAQERKVRYMVVDLDDNELKLDHRKILLPIGLAELDEKDDDVIIPTVNAEQLRQLPDYDKNHLTPDVERNVCSVLGRNIDRYDYSAGAEALEKDKTLQKEVRQEEKEEEKRLKKERSSGKYDSSETDPDFYRHEYYSLDNFYKNRMHEAAPVSGKKESEYDRGLKLWERRSEGGLLPGETDRGNYSGAPRSREGYIDDLDEERKMEMVRRRRENYRQRRFGNPQDSDDLSNENIKRKRSDDY